MQQVTYDWRKDAAHGERLKGWIRTLSCLLCAACGLGLFFHLGSGGGSFITALLAFIVPCMGYKAVNNHSSKHLGWFNCLNICCAVVAAITMVGVLLIGIPIAECACHEECLVNMIDGFEEAANMTSGAEYEYGPQPLDHFEHDTQGPVLAFPEDEGQGVPEPGAPRGDSAPGAMHPHPQPHPHPEASRRMSRIGRLLAMVGMGAPHPHPHPHGHRMHPHPHPHHPHHPHHRLGGHRRRAQEHHEHVHEHKRGEGEGEDDSHRGHKFVRAVKGAIRAVWVAFDHHVHGGEHGEAPVADFGEPMHMPTEPVTEPVTTLPFQLDGQPEADTADENREHVAEIHRPHDPHHVIPGHDGRKAAMTRLGRMRGFGSKDGAGQAPASFRKAAMGGRALQAGPQDGPEYAEVEERQVAQHGAGMPGSADAGAGEGSEGGHMDESERHQQQREEDEHNWHHWSPHHGDEDEDEDEEDWSHPMSPEERAEKLDNMEQMCRAGLPYFGIMVVFIINGLGLALHSVAAHVGRSLAEHDIMKTPAPGAQPQQQEQGQVQVQPAAQAPPAPPAPPSSAGSSGGSGSARPSDGTAAAAVQRDTSAADAHRATWYQRLFAGSPSAQGYSQVGGASSGGMIEMQAHSSAVSSGGNSEQQRLNPTPYGATIGAVPMPSQSQGAGAPSSVVHSGAPAML